MLVTGLEQLILGKQIPEQLTSGQLATGQLIPNTDTRSTDTRATDTRTPGQLIPDCCQITQITVTNLKIIVLNRHLAYFANLCMSNLIYHHSNSNLTKVS